MGSYLSCSIAASQHCHLAHCSSPIASLVLLAPKINPRKQNPWGRGACTISAPQRPSGIQQGLSTLLTKPRKREIHLPPVKLGLGSLEILHPSAARRCRAVTIGHAGLLETSSCGHLLWLSLTALLCEITPHFTGSKSKGTCLQSHSQ